MRPDNVIVMLPLADSRRITREVSQILVAHCEALRLQPQVAEQTFHEILRCGFLSIQRGKPYQGRGKRDHVPTQCLRGGEDVSFEDEIVLGGSVQRAGYGESTGIKHSRSLRANCGCARKQVLFASVCTEAGAIRLGVDK